MFTEFRITLEDKPGELARLSTTLGDAGVNIEAIQGVSHDGFTRVQFVPHDPDRAIKALDEAGQVYETREVLIVKVLDEPGMLGDVGFVISEAGINIDSVYLTTRGHVVLGVDDLSGAIQIAGGMAAMVPEYA